MQQLNQTASHRRNAGTRKSHRVMLAAAFMALPVINRAAHAASITFGNATNISGDGDVLNIGSLTYAYDWADTDVTVNQVPFTGTSNITGSGDGNVGLFAVLAPTGSTAPAGPIANGTSYLTTVATNPQNYSSAYTKILAGGDYDNHTPGTDTFVVTLGSLIQSHEYAVQVWDNDARPKAGRAANISGGANTVTLIYSVGNAAGSPGQYTVGGFAATGTTQTFNISGTAVGSNPKGPNTQINLLQMRDVTGVWSGAASGSWDSSSGNFTGGNNFSTVSGLVSTDYFADTDGLDNPITNNSITIQPGGVSIANVIFQNNLVNYTFDGSDATGMTGSGNVLKTGSGEVTFLSSNTYTGRTNVSEGVLSGAAAGSFGSGSLTINPIGSTGTTTDAASVYSNASIAPSASVTVNTNSSTAVGTLVLQDQTPTIGSLAGNGTVLLANASGSVLSTGGNNANSVFSGTLSDAGAADLLKIGIGNFTLSGSNSYHGWTNVSGGTLTVASTSALPASTRLNISSGAVVNISLLSTSTAITLSNVSAGGILNLNGNALIVHNGIFASINAQVAAGYNGGNWNGSGGIESATAAADTAHLTALGVIVNDDGTGTQTPLYGSRGAISGTFDGASPAEGDILVKYTYYGDTNLDGVVDGTDYARIDHAYLTDLTSPGSMTGWFNGDFNYDGVIDGSDYTLIDNAFNSQGASLTGLIGSPKALATAQIGGEITAGSPASSPVPEPASLGFIAIMTAGLLGRRR